MIRCRLFILGVLTAALGLATGCARDMSGLASIAADLSAAQGSSAEDTYMRHLGALVAQDGLTRFDLLNGIGARHKPERLPSGPVATQRKQLAALAAPAASSRGVAADGESSGEHRFTDPWRTSRQTLYLAPANPDSGTGPFTFSGLQSRDIEIQIVAASKQAYRLTLVCDGSTEVVGPGGLARHPPGRRFTLASRSRDRRDKPVILRPGNDTTRCEGQASFAQGSRMVTLLREEIAHPALATFDARFDVCRVPDDARATRLERVFYSDRWLSQTCPFALGKTALLTDERDAFNAKVEALLGAGLSDRFLDAGDPELPLDFSRAPKLSLIIVSYLDIKADFSGRILDRLLRFHAGRGATIRIIASRVLVRDKDSAMLERLAADHPNVQFKTFSWIPPRATTLGERLSRFHKVHHTKLLAAVSSEPGRSVAILGGRNIHDGFLFHEPVDLSRYPALQQYGRNRGLTLNYYSNWRDLDVALHDDAAVRALTAHFSTLWFDDARTHVARPFSAASSGGRVSHNGVARHFISVPYADGRALESYYVDLIDAADRSIEIVNPYLNLTPSLGAAIERAVSRSVTITIVGRVDLRGDLGGDMVTALNEDFVSKYADRIAIYDYKDTELLLHAKILLIDGRLATVSSVNFNNRSFIHDNENGLTTLDAPFYRRVKTVFDTYRAAAQPVEVRAVPLAWRLLFTSKMVREAL